MEKSKKSKSRRNAIDWFEKRGCTRSNKKERRCPDYSYEKHPATYITGDKPD